MNKREKILQLIPTASFEDGVGFIIAKIRGEMCSVEGAFTPDSARALEEFRSELLNRRQDWLEGIVNAYDQNLTEQHIDALLVLATAPNYMNAVEKVHNEWLNKVFQTSPFHDVVRAAGVDWTAKNTEGDVAQSVTDAQ